MIDTKPTLRAWIDEYDSIEQEWIATLQQQGIRFAPAYQDAKEIADARARLKAKGARFLNGGASISVGPISSACVACTGDCGSRTFFLSLACNRNCYFCFNPNQDNFDQLCTLKKDWEAEVDDFLNAKIAPTHAALTGGEPLLYKEQTKRFFSKINQAAPDVHLRLYTSGDFLDDELAQALASAGLQEMRLSVKLGDGEESDARAIDEAIERLALAKQYIPDVMVEMPVIPGTEDVMRMLLKKMDELGVFGINLLEFCYPYGCWDEYEKRGFAVKNPPFEVLYNYDYAGGLPIAGSELACLELLEFALDEGLSMGVHYCSLDNKNRDQILQLDVSCPYDDSLYQLDEGDYFLKTLKVFDSDVPIASKQLDAIGAHYAIDTEDGSLMTHPRNAAQLVDLGLDVALSINVAQHDELGWGIRELKLILLPE